ncbi:MAG TPA: Isoquinoline 1-oxidoreductase subunit [Polyangiaceae bacterium]|nr:Isoquinoline 1-oxidoreductase subunit [Polyangiaceae bacterium]
MSANETPVVRFSGCGILRFVFCTVAAVGCSRQAGDAQSPGAPLPPASPGALRPLAVFEAVPAGPERGRALFTEASRVLLHPRCVNCHVEGDSPGQGQELALHEPPVVRGPDDRGVVGMECRGCHQDQNLELSRVPGAPDWRLPPRAMAWVGRSPGQLCEQLKDRARNGGRALAEVVDHVDHDPLVAWGWAPGADRPPAPGSQAEFTALMGAWVESGADCPASASESHD